MTSFKKLLQRQAEMVGRLVEFSKLSRDLVEKVVQYAKHLVQPGTDEITDNTFMAQMISIFGLTNSYMVNRMFEVLLHKKQLRTGKDIPVNCRSIALEDYCVCICTFFTCDMEIKAEWAFSVFDVNSDGELAKVELYQLLKPCVLHSDDMDTEEAIKDLIDIVMSVVDLDKSGFIDLDEFKNLVKHDVLYLGLLGDSMPSETIVQSFLQNIKKMTPMEVSKMFQSELDKSFIIPTVPIENTLYPFLLDLP